MPSNPTPPHEADGCDVIITGASGFLGDSLVPCLQQAGYRLLLCGRDPAALAQRYPGHRVCAPPDLAAQAQGVRVLLHLAVRNNDQPGDEDSFMQANLDGLKRTLGAARAAGVREVIYPASLHAQDVATPYAKSKYAAERYLREQDDLRITVLWLPAVYAEHFKGRLAVLNSLPALLRPAALALLGAIKPVVPVQQVCDAVREVLEGPATVGGQDIWVTRPQSENLVYRLVARFVDLSFAIAVIGLFWWLLLAMWVLVRLSSPGPGLFAQERVGRHEAPFVCYKFRTMQQGTKVAGTHEVSQASVTKIGQFLRRSKVDELPQVWNILKGELSLVGPRPCLPVQKELIAARRARRVFDIRPGITGLAQVRGVDMSEPERLAALDARYMHTRALAMDIRIILATFLGRGAGDNTAAAPSD